MSTAIPGRIPLILALAPLVIWAFAEHQSARSTPSSLSSERLVRVRAPSIQASICATRVGGAGPVTRDSGSIGIVENWSPIFPSEFGVRVADQPGVIIGRQGGADDQFVRIAGATRLSDGRIVVGDGSINDVRLFDATGRFARRLGRAGQGPGEYQSVTSVIRLPGDTILVSDYEAHRLTYLRPDGSLIRTRSYVRVPTPAAPRAPPSSRQRPPVRASVLGQYQDGSFLLTSRPPIYAPSPPTFPRVTNAMVIVHRLHGDLDRLDSVAAHPWVSIFTRANPSRPGFGTGTDIPFAPTGDVASRSDGFYQTQGDRYEVVRHDPNGRPVEIVRLCRAPTPVTPADIARWRSAFLAPATVSGRPMLEETARQVPHPRFKPAMTHLLVDAAGRLWAGSFAFDSAALARRANSSPGPRVWHVFDSDGRLLGDVETPAGLIVLEIGNDYLLARHVDEDNVETVRMHSLRPR